MQNGQPFRKCRNAVRRIETEENERLRRPVIEYPIGSKRPAAHMGQPFSFAQVKFASFRLARLLCNPLLSTFSVFDIEARSKPFHDVPVFVMKRRLPVQKRPICSVRAPNARFSFERFPACQSRTPFLNYSSNIFRMNRFSPPPTTHIL